MDMCNNKDLLQFAVIALLVFSIITMYYHREGLMDKMRHVNLKNGIYGIAQKFTSEGYECDRYNSTIAYPSSWLG